MPVLLGLASAFLIGGSDFFGRHVSRRSHPLTHLGPAFVAGAVVSAVLLLLVPSEWSVRAVGLGVISGVAIAGALAVLYRGLTVASVSVVSPPAAVAGAVGPVVWDAVVDELPSALSLVGIVVALASLVLTSWTPTADSGDRRRGLVLGVVAGALVAVALIATGVTDEASGMVPVVTQRLVGAVLAVTVALALGLPRIPPGRLRWNSVISGVFGGSALAAFTAGAQRGSLAAVTVASSLYPAVTAILAATFDHDELHWWQLVGIAAAAVGIGLVVAG